jgi:hypothetical protein
VAAFCSPLFEITLMLVRLDHVASRIVDANHGVPIGFCLIRRSSGNPIVCFYQSNQISAHSKRKAKARFGPLAWINERREEGTSAAFPSL